MANTVIQLKYSTVNNTPASLNVGEPAYSFTSEKLFIGNSTNHVLTIGGEYYTKIIDAATSSNVPDTLVLRDSEGSFSANVVTANIVFAQIDGNAATASKLEAPFDLGLSGDATGNVSIDGSANVTLTVDITNSGVAAGSYGSTTQIATFDVAADGRITSAANVNIATTLGFAGDSGSGNLDLLTDSLTLIGGDGVDTTANDTTNAITIDVDNTVVRNFGNQTIGGDLAVAGNLIVSGNTVTYDVEQLRIADSVMLLANGNIGDIVDIGFTAHYGDTGDNHTGLIRHAQDGIWYLFENYTDHFLHDLNTLNIADPTFVTANLFANITGGKVYDLAQAIEVEDGGTGANTFNSGQIIIGNGTGALQSLANTGTAGTYANASHIPIITTDVWGRVSGVVNTAISIDTAQVSSGILPIARGGTNNDAFTTGAITYYDGSKLASIANTTYVQTGTLSTSNTITSISVDDYGRFTAATTQKIDIDTSQVTSGILPVVRGGTGSATFTQNGVLLGNGTNPVSTASSSTEGHVLTINASGVPTFEMLSGGTF